MIEFLFLGGFAVAMFCGHSERSRRTAENIARALDEAYPSQKVASIEMGLDAGGTKLSRQLAGKDPLNLYRLDALSDEFQIAFLKRQAARFGAVLITREERGFVLGALELGKARMARFLPSIFDEEKVS